MFRTESEIVWTNSQPYTYWHYDLEPATMKGRNLEIDPLAPADILAEQLKTAKEWDDADQAYYEKLRAEREENKVEA
jgi:ssDNA-binding replication factor A large subunit